MFYRASLHARRSVDEENPYWISFSDIMAGLLVIFILASIQLVIELNKKKDTIDKSMKELTQANQIRAELLEEIRAELIKRNIHVEVSDNKTVLRIPEEQLHFRTNSYFIPYNKRPLVAAIGETIYQSLLKNDRYQYLDTIFVEGHTDSRPATKVELGNWGLSANRAIQVWRFWTEENENTRQLADLKNFSGLPLFSVSGYAATRRLVLEEVTPEDLRKNRRIDLRVTVRQPNITDYKGLLDEF